MSNDRSFAYLQPGFKLGKYEIKGLIGRGAMAEVYRAHNPVLKNDVAIKVMNPGIMDNEEAAARFRREAQAAARLSHPNVMRVFDFDIEGNIYYMVMELLEGRTLRDLLREYREGMPHEQAIEIIKQLAGAVDYAHQQGIIHRDIKPTNIIMVGERAVLSDFGLARISDQAQLTATGSSAGTPAYMSPEQASGEKITTRSDIYSIGITLYEMITGAPPFQGETFASILVQQIQAQPRMPSEIVADIDPVLEAVIMRALSKSPDERYPTAHAMLEDLERKLEELPEATTIFRTPRIIETEDAEATVSIPAVGRISGSHPTLVTVAERRRQRALLGGITIVAILLGMAVLFLVLGNMGNDDDEAAAPEAPAGMVYVPGGTFNMGTTSGEENEGPPHRVTVSEFFIDQYEVTNADYAAFVQETGYREPATWERPEPSIWQISASGVYVAGDFSNQFAYDGEGIEYYDNGTITVELDADQDSGTIIVEFTGTAQPSTGRVLEGSFRIEHTVFEQGSPFHEGGVGDHVLMHGDSGQEEGFIPRIISPVSTWGDADIFFEGGTLARGVGAHMMLMPGIRDEQGRILRADGSCCFDPINPADGFVDEDDLELMIILFQGSVSGYGGGVTGGEGLVPVQNIWLNIYAEDVTIEERPTYEISQFDAAIAKQPVTGVSYAGAQAYCEWVDKQLPTEAQWELAAGGVQEFTYPWGNERVVGERVPANVSSGQLMDVGSFPQGRSPYGAYDMAGNAWEWVSDFYGEDYYSQSVDAVDPAGPSSGDFNILRGGGSQNLNPVGIAEFRTTSRLIVEPNTENANFGFRCASPVFSSGEGVE